MVPVPRSRIYHYDVVSVSNRVVHPCDTISPSVWTMKDKMNFTVFWILALTCLWNKNLTILTIFEVLIVYPVDWFRIENFLIKLSECAIFVWPVVVRRVKLTIVECLPEETQHFFRVPISLIMSIVIFAWKSYFLRVHSQIIECSILRHLVNWRNKCIILTTDDIYSSFLSRIVA